MILFGFFHCFLIAAWCSSKRTGWSRGETRCRKKQTAEEPETEAGWKEKEERRSFEAKARVGNSKRTAGAEERARWIPSLCCM